MNIKTAAIVLHCSRVSDRTSILHVFTRECGRMYYYVYGGRRKGDSFLPLTLLDIEAVHLETREIQQIREQRVRYVATNTSSDICRSTEALFMAEVLYRTLTHQLADPLLFDFLEETIHQLDLRPDPENVHLEFLVAYIAHLGFAIDEEDPQNQVFLPFLSGERLSRPERQHLLRKLINYYSQHLPDFTVPKSLDVMTEVFA